MSQQIHEIYEFGSFRLDAKERLLQRDGATIALTPKAFDLLLALVERHGRLVEKEERFQVVWPDTIVEESNLSSNIALIRKALGDGTNGLKLIETVPKRGYRFVAEVRKVSRRDGEPTPAARVPVRETQAEIARPRRQVHPLLWVLFVAGLLMVGYFATVRRFAARVSDLAPLTTITPFTTLPGRESEPTFSPDGNQIAFVWNGERGDNQDIYVKQMGNETPLRLTTNPASDRGPSWSPDGRWIAFTRRANDEIGLYLIPSLGGAERKIAVLAPILTQEFTAALSWTPDSEWLVVQDKGSPEEPYGIWLVSRETGEKRRLTTPPADQSDWGPAVAPDGKTVVFIRTRTPNAGDLYLVPITGGAARQVVFDQETLASQPVWTPDGHAILFLSNRGIDRNSNNLWQVPVTGGVPVKVETVKENLRSFALARSGHRLAWGQNLDDLNIWRLEQDATGKPKSAPQPVIASTRLDVDARFSPDGSKVVFASNRSGSLQIWVAASDGQHPVALTNMVNAGSPRWSPDGRQIAFDSRAADGNKDIYVVNAEGGKPRRLTTEPTNEALPSWSRDGNWIYFCSNCNSSKQQIWKMPATGGQAVQVTRNGGFDNVESPDGQFLYFTKGYQVPGIWRVPVVGGEETLVLDHHRAGQWRYWAVREQGIYFATAETPERPQIEFFSFATGKVTPVATLEKRIGYSGFAGLDVSPDGRWLIWQQLDQEGSDIMLLENFR